MSSLLTTVNDSSLLVNVYCLVIFYETISVAAIYTDDPSIGPLL